MRTVFIDVGGVNTRCVVAGSEFGRPILLIHGLTLIADIWVPHIKALAQHDFRIIAPDMVGSGFTDSPVVDGRPMLMHKIDHLCSLVDSLGVDSFCVSGSSYGALVAALMYLRLGNRVDRLIINGSGSCFNSADEIALNMKRTYTTNRPTLGNSTCDEWRQRVAQSFYDKSIATPDLVALLMTCYARTEAVTAWERTIRDMLDPSVFQPFSILHRLAEFKVRTLVAWGRQDPGAPYQNAVSAMRLMPQAELVTFEECGHMPMLEHPDAYSNAVLDFLADWRPVRHTLSSRRERNPGIDNVNA